MISDPARISKLKLSARPATTATARATPGFGARWSADSGAAAAEPVAPATSTTGNTGKMHGEMPASKPATSPTSTSPIMGPSLPLRVRPARE